jgi:hypothetical protein
VQEKEQIAKARTAKNDVPILMIIFAVPSHIKKGNCASSWSSNRENVATGRLINAVAVSNELRLRKGRQVGASWKILP